MLAALFDHILIKYHMTGQIGPNLKMEESTAGIEIDLSKYLRLILYTRCHNSTLQLVQIFKVNIVHKMS